MKEIILKVEGMMCNGCENRVQNVLKNIDGVEEVTASFMKKTVKVTSKTDISEEILKKEIEDLGYEVIE